MSNDQLHNTAGANLSVSDVSLDVSGVASPVLPTSLTLTGSGFGAIANPKPTSYDTFNDYAGLVNGDAIPLNEANPYWGSTLNSPTDDSEFVLDNSIKYGSREFGIRGSNPVGGVKKPRSTLINAVDRPDGAPRDYNYYYVTWVNRFNESLGNPPQSGGSNKFLRVWDYVDNSAGAVSLVASLNKLDMNAVTYYPDGLSTATETPNKFYRYEFYIDVPNDKSFLYINGKLALTIPSNAGHRAPATDPFYTRMIGFDPSDSSRITSTLRHWNWEYYSQPTAARVELSHQAIYDNSVMQDRPPVYQYVDSRTDTEIIINNAFYGDLDQSQPIYAHVIKHDQSVAASIQVGI